MAEREHEQRVSNYIGAMSFLWLDVPDEPGSGSERAFIKSNAIALLSNSLDPVDTPSEEWLGRHSTRKQIRESGLWNLRHKEEECDPRFIEILERVVRRTADRPH